MNLTQIASADLKRVVALVEQKEALLAQVAQIDAELTSIESGEPATPVAPTKGRPGRKPGRPAKAKTGGKHEAVVINKGIKSRLRSGANDVVPIAMKRVAL
jgi:hypothetical protein